MIAADRLEPFDRRDTIDANALMADVIRRHSGIAGSVCFRTGTAPAQVPAPALTPPGGGGQVIPFRRATTEKTEILTGEAFTAAAALTRIKRTAEGNGFIYGVVLDVQAITAANAAAVTFTEDAPWNAIDSCVLSDAAGELVNLSGFDLFVANLCGKQYASRFADNSATLFQALSGAGATGGSFKFMIRVPVALNRRSLTGMVGNQDRGTKYDLRTDFAASASIYTTAPTTLPPVTIDKYYEFYTLPADVITIDDGYGHKQRFQQQQYPDDYGRLHFITANDAESAPAPSSTKNHYLRRIGNTIRYIAVVLRAGAGTTPRNVAELNLPTAFTFKIGDDTIFRETPRKRRFDMWERYGFDFPSGTFVWDALHDLGTDSGNEIGDDYYYTQGLNNAQLIVTYPAGFTAGGSIHFITDDLQEVEVAA